MGDFILIVEDTWQVRNLLKKVVKHFCPNHEVVAVDTAMEAVMMVEEGRVPCLVITDLEMAEMSGYDLIAWLHEDSRTHDVPVMIVSSFADCTNDRYITGKLHDLGLPSCPIAAKPLDMMDFREKVVQALRGKKPKAIPSVAEKPHPLHHQ